MNDPYVLRKDSFESDALEIRVGDRFVVSDEGSCTNPRFLYGKSRFLTTSGQGFMVTGVWRFRDDLGVQKIGITTYEVVNGRLSVFARAEKVFCNSCNTGHLLGIDSILPYHNFLLEHGCTPETNPFNPIAQ